MDELVCYLILVMDKSFTRNDPSFSDSLYHHHRLEIIQDVLKHISIYDVSSYLSEIVMHYSNVSIEFGNLSAWI